MHRQGDILDVTHETGPRFDGRRFRRVLSHFATGVVVVTGRTADGHPAGLTCQSFSSLSLEPPLIMVAPAKSSTSWPAIWATGRFAVNILGTHQQELSDAFARRSDDKFAGVDWEWSEHGLPLITASLATIESRIVAVHDAGDHRIVVGHVEDVSSLEDRDTIQSDPLLYYRSSYGGLSQPDS